MTMSLGEFAFAKGKDRDRTFRRRARQLGFRSNTAGICRSDSCKAPASRARITAPITSITSRTIQRCFLPCIIGENDPRRTEIAEMQHQIAPDHLAVLLFHGGHQWAPADAFAKALSWIESRAPR